MSDRTLLMLYLVGVVVTAATLFRGMLGRSETSNLVAGTFFGGLLWPPFLCLLAIGLIVEWVDHLNTRRRVTLTARDEALAETERWLKDGAA